MRVALNVVESIPQFLRLGLGSRLGAHRAWPSRALLLDEPLALAEERTNRLRRIYEKCASNLWDGPSVFREAVARHGGIQLAYEQRPALAQLITMLMWGELAAWTVSAELTERLEDPDARMAASSQVFDEARHFYLLRDYLALLHVPVPALDPYFVAGVRTLLDSRDLDLKLLAMQILVEGSAQGIFHFLAASKVEPVLSEILPYIERDEARHVGLGVLHLPERLSRLAPARRRRIARKTRAIGDMLGMAQVRLAACFRALGLEPRELLRSIDVLLMSLSRKLGTVPGTSEPYFRSRDPESAEYQALQELLLPLPNSAPSARNDVLRRLVAFGGRVLAT